MNNIHRSLLVLAIIAGLPVVFVLPISANEPDDGTHSDHHALHFAHPMFTESPFPDHKVRLDYLFENRTGDEGEAHTPSLTGEYRLIKTLSTEVKIPYTFSRPDEGEDESRLNNTRVAVKYANFHFQDQGLLVGGGLEVGLPTGDEDEGIGSDEIVLLEPFVNVGYKPVPDLELVGRFAVGHTTNADGSDVADHEVVWSASALYHATPVVKPNVELFGERVSGGEEDGLSTANVAAGLKIQPLQDRKMNVGLSGAVPVSDDQEADARVLFSTFYHF